MNQHPEGLKKSEGEAPSHLADTLAGLEGQLARSVGTTTGDISNTARNIGDTVGLVAHDITEAVGDVSHSVAASVGDATRSLGRLLDVTGHVRRHPWAGLGVSVFVGFVLGGALRS
jgi:ElaB/YqjD/DUF883 family membrane-anchored ribosome-binding protein